ncbi:MAG: ABC transporter ATP-binding protein [Rhodospirillales bacterium]|nr:ABC transporter ATP-binding protein [Rhodospirillales bacterium]
MDFIVPTIKDNIMFLQLINVGRSFGGLQAVNAVDLTVEKGEILGLMGANGAGKTTLFNLIAGNLKPTTGEIWLEGKRTDGLRADQLNRMGVGRAFQIVRPFSGLTVLENVVIGCLFGRGHEQSITKAQNIAKEILDQVGIVERADDKAGTLTLAGRKKLEIARSLATQPSLLLLDEVMAGLTPVEVSEALETVSKLHREQGLTIIVIEHVMRALMHLSERLVVLHHGSKIAEGTPKEISESKVVNEVYFGNPKE